MVDELHDLAEKLYKEAPAKYADAGRANVPWDHLTAPERNRALHEAGQQLKHKPAEPPKPAPQLPEKDEKKYGAPSQDASKEAKREPEVSPKAGERRGQHA